jgi:hypothetical protein
MTKRQIAFLIVTLPVTLPTAILKLLWIAVRVTWQTVGEDAGNKQ